MKYFLIYLFSFMLVSISTLNAQTKISLTQEERTKKIQGQHIQKAFGIKDTIDYAAINPKRRINKQSSSKEIISKQTLSGGKRLPNETKGKTLSQEEIILREKAKSSREAFGIEY